MLESRGSHFQTGLTQRPAEGLLHSSERFYYSLGFGGLLMNFAQ